MSEQLNNDEKLLNQIVEALTKFNLNRITLLQKAFDESGMDAVTKVEDARNSLADSHFEILQARLDRNHHRFEELTKKAINETREIENSIVNLEKVSSLINKISKAVSAIGQVLIVLGV